MGVPIFFSFQNIEQHYHKLLVSLSRGVRPKFRHSLEHIVPGKKPPPLGKEFGPAGVAAPLTDLAPPARAPGEGFGPKEGESPELAAPSSSQLLRTRGVRAGHSARGGRAERKGDAAAARRAHARGCAHAQRHPPPPRQGQRARACRCHDNGCGPPRDFQGERGKK